MNRDALFVSVQFALFGALALANIALPRQAGPLATPIALVLGLAGLVIFLASLWAFSPTRQRLPSVVPTPAREGDLVTRGPYARIRHPIYTAVLCLAFSTAIYHGHPGVWAIAFALTGWLWAKSRYEETLLRAQFPEYKAYAQRTGRFLPRLR